MRPRYEDTNTFFWIRVADSPVPCHREVWGWTPKNSARRTHRVTVRIPGAASPRLVDARRVCRLNQWNSPPRVQRPSPQRRFKVPTEDEDEALGVAVLGQRGHSPYNGPRVGSDLRAALPTVMNGLSPKTKYVNKSIFPRLSWRPP